MQPAVSVLFFKPEFEDFVYASIDSEIDVLPLSVLSALTRLGIDPWLEAATLSEMSSEAATQRLEMLITRLPGRRGTLKDREAIARRLAALLPRNSQSDKSLRDSNISYDPVNLLSFVTTERVLIIILLLVIAFLRR